MRYAWVLVALVACTRTPAGPNAVTYPSCGPTDGPAEVIRIVDGPADCSVAEHGKRAHLAVELWSSSLREKGGALEGSAGSARACSATGECRALAGASVTFRHEGDGTTSGTLTYREGSETVTRVFRALSCHVQPIMCG